MTDRLVTTWFGPSLPRLHALCIGSWIAAGHEAVVYTFRDRIEGMPPGVTLLNGENILSQDKVFFLKGQTNYAHFSDIFRMELLRRELGIWCDADYMVLRPFPEREDIMLARERNDWPCNAVMWMRPDHPIVLGVLENFERTELAEWTYIKPRWHAFLARLQGKPYTIADLPNGHWGRHALDYYTRKLRLGAKLLPQDTFYAEETYTGELFEAKPFDRLIDSEAVKGLHFFHKVGMGLEPTPGSFYAWAHEKFGGYLS